MRPERWLLVFLLGLACGCDNEVTVVKSQSCLDGCLSAAADFDLDAHLDIVADLRASFEAARAGLSAYASVAHSLTGFVQAMVDFDPSMPAGLTYEGAGLYSMSPSADTRVELSFYLPLDTSYGSANQLIDFNLFDVDNYFVSFGVETSASIGPSGLSTNIAFTFDGAGPGAELLGVAAGTKSPISVDVSAFSAALAKVVVHANVIVEHASASSSTAFTLTPVARRVGLVADGAIPVAIRNFAGSVSRTGQELKLGDAELQMLRSGAAYDGNISLLSVSPDFSFDMLFSYQASASADVVLGCPGSTLVLP
jgi:hypothetical protein